ncbi:hypothetical protein SDC9_140543 [bioreactor metagenome]|uniref:Uncharacterized protein n=1 Tax=bioreactor metagenome TaxID=1076179 RepID=A0A645DVP5_9ZZZZ
MDDALDPERSQPLICGGVQQVALDRFQPSAILPRRPGEVVGHAAAVGGHYAVSPPEQVEAHIVADESAASCHKDLHNAHAPLSGAASSLSTASSSNSVPVLMSAGSVYSSLLWLMPPALGTKIITAGT